jgi:hypothetical protein
MQDNKTQQSESNNSDTPIDTKSLVKRFNVQIKEAEHKRKVNPFSEEYDANLAEHDVQEMRQKKSNEYGRPEAGSKTELRGIQVIFNVIIWKQI